MWAAIGFWDKRFVLCALYIIRCYLLLGIHPRDYWKISVLQENLSASLNWSLLISKVSSKSGLVFKHWPRPCVTEWRSRGLVSRSRHPLLSLSQRVNLVHLYSLVRFQLPIPLEEGLSSDRWGLCGFGIQSDWPQRRGGQQRPAALDFLVGCKGES